MQQSDLPDLDAVEAFVALADTGSFAAAARRIGRDPTVVSRRLAALERHLGVRLAERTTRRVALTEAGDAYLVRARQALHSLGEAAREAASYSRGEPHGCLRLALPTSFGRLWLAPLVVGFAEAHPRIVVEASYSNRLVDIVAEGFDAAVRLAELADSRLVARKVASRRRLVCAAPGYLAGALSIAVPADVARHTCLCFTGRANWRRWRFARPDGSTETIGVTARLASDDADMLVEAALAGLGLFYTTDWHVGPHLARGRLVEILPEWTVPDAGGIYVVTASAAGMPTKTRAFSDWIAEGLTPAPWSR